MMHLAMYKAKGEFFDRAVRWRTGSEYSHCEIVVAGQAFSSSIRDGGVRSKMIIFNEASWDLYPIRDIPELDARLFEHFARCRGMKYDWRGILIEQVFGTHAGTSNKRYCSAFCGEVLVSNRHLSPQGLLDSVREQKLLLQ